MESFEDDEDTHFCNKCHSTINGLENYVRHRQSGCRNTEDEKTVVYHSPASTPNVSYPEILNADAFFSSLELQSSSKCHQRRSTDLLDIRGKKCNRQEDLKKRKRKDKNFEDKDETKEKLPNLLPVVTDLDDLGIPSLVGFSEIVTSTSSSVSKPNISNILSSNKQTNRSSSTSSKVEDSVYPPKHEITVTDQKRNQVENQRLDQHHSVWLEDTILTDLVTSNENENKDDMGHAHLDRYAEYEYQQDEESDDDSLDVDIPEEDSYSDSEDTEIHDTQYPPQSHTGGKWKPGGTVQEEMLNDDDVEMDETEQQHQEHPPPNHTGGKWKPIDSTIQKCDEYENKDDSGQPPPGHTRGKWVPGARAEINAGYWCNPCGRKLASRLVYNRHLLSDLHARRSIQEIDGALQISKVSAPRPHHQNLSRRQKILALKRNLDSNNSTQPKPIKVSLKQMQKKKLRKREKEVLSCEMCHARVRRAQLGKHLLSHYHCRVAGVNPSTTNARRFLLENMVNIVRQCPFQCASCRFYCNTENTFLRHWRSHAHKDTVSKIGGSFICTLCDFWCDDNESVEVHIMTQEHQDVVSMINGSVPIVIRRQRILSCSTCQRRFRYNMQLRLHAKDTGHQVDNSASDEYQSRLSCNVCGQIMRSLISLQRHQLACHKSGTEDAQIASPYFCSFCSLTFKKANEAVLHRRTSAHKEMVRSKKAENTPTSSMRRTCPYCEETLGTLAEYKRHLLLQHPKLCHRCSKCGKQFALSQDVTKHTRNNQCSLDDKNSYENLNTGQWKCTTCRFTTDSTAEYLFHNILHTGAEKCTTPVKEGEPTSVPKFQCSHCEKLFSKSTLRDHLRRHTGERPYSCTRCLAKFFQRSAVKNHQKECIGKEESDWQLENIRVRNYVCSECDSAFYTKHVLRQHMLRHIGKQYKCGLPGCPTILRTETELKNHRSLVHEIRNSNEVFQCNDCNYVAKSKIQLARHQRRHQKVFLDDISQRFSCQYVNCNFQTVISSHLKRHMRLHTGKKPYKCRHCNYASNNLENLRKHVLLTSLHPGKMIYQCESCRGDEKFQTNFSKQLRAHLLQFHADEYPTPNAASNYVAGIFNESDDVKTCDK